jgi:diguanylate cyclase (GGDEF)-like protein
MSPESSAPQAAALHVLAVTTDADTGWLPALDTLAADHGWGRFVVERCGDHASALQQLAQAPVDALLAGESAGRWPGLAQAALNAAVLLVTPSVPAPEAVQRWLQMGVQDLLPAPLLAQPGELARALVLAARRKQAEREARKAYATDLATGLPSHSQLIEHMSHLLALREREPAPMALLVLRLEGLHATQQRLGSESSQVLRRKAAVRLRAGVRASDVVAALGADAFAVLLSAIEEPEHAHAVADKLAAALRQPFSVAGEQVALAASVGCAIYPRDGRLADPLLRVAVTAAATSPAQGRGGFSEAGPARAANDDEAP